MDRFPICRKNYMKSESLKSPNETSSIPAATFVFFLTRPPQPGEFGHAEPHRLQCRNWASAICATVQVTGLASVIETIE